MKKANPDQISNYLKKVVNPEYFIQSIEQSLRGLKGQAAQLLLARDGLLSMEIQKEDEKEKTVTLERYNRQLFYLAEEIKRLNQERARFPRGGEGEVEGEDSSAKILTFPTEPSEE